MSPNEDQIQPQEGKKVSILGFAESWKLAPFDDHSVEIWGLNELHKYVKRWDRWFEVHDDETLGVTKREHTDGEQQRHIQWLKEQPYGKPIYMQPQFVGKDIPAAVELPLQWLIDALGRYFTSSIGYMLGIAIVETIDARRAGRPQDEYRWIGLYGVDLASDVEYPGQRPNTEYLIGIARGMGIHVEIPATSALLKAGHLYGFEKPLGEQGGIKTAIAGRIKTLRSEHEKHLATLNTIDGAIQEAENVLRLYDFKERGCHVPGY